MSVHSAETSKVVTCVPITTIHEIEIRLVISAERGVQMIFNTKIRTDKTRLEIIQSLWNDW